MTRYTLRMRTMQVSRFKATCLAVLDQVARTGEPILVTRHGKPLARVMPPPPSRWAQRLGALKGTVSFHGDIGAPVVEPEEWEVLR